MITLDYVIYDCIANACLLAFASLSFKRIRFSWVLVLASLTIKIFIYGKYGIATSSIFLSAQILSAVLVTIVWLREPTYIKPTKKGWKFSIILSLLILGCWIGLMYTYVNPAIVNYHVLFGFEYLCYMLFVIGTIICMFRMVAGLLFIAVELISYAVNYANSAVVLQTAPEHIKAFMPYYWASAIFLFVAGIILVITYTNVKRNN